MDTRPISHKALKTNTARKHLSGISQPIIVRMGSLYHRKMNSSLYSCQKNNSAPKAR